MDERTLTEVVDDPDRLGKAILLRTRIRLSHELARSLYRLYLFSERKANACILLGKRAVAVVVKLNEGSLKQAIRCTRKSGGVSSALCLTVLRSEHVALHYRGAPSCNRSPCLRHSPSRPSLMRDIPYFNAPHSTSYNAILIAARYTDATPQLAWIRVGCAGSSNLEQLVAHILEDNTE